MKVLCPKCDTRIDLGYLEKQGAQMAPCPECTTIVSATFKKDANRRYWEIYFEQPIRKKPLKSKKAVVRECISIARLAREIKDLSKLNEIAAKLPKGDKGIFAQIEELRAWIYNISNLQRRLDAIDRHIFHEPLASELYKEIQLFLYRITSLHKPIASEFQIAAMEWLEIARQECEKSRRVISKMPMLHMFHAGGVVNREQIAFVPRYSVVGELEQQVTLSTGCPGIVLYGRRRMGKSTILHNLTGFLPPNVMTVSISMQNPNLFASLESMARALSVEIQKQFPTFGVAANSVSNLRGLFGFLKALDEQLEADGKRLLLAVDEYEMIDKKIGEGVFTADLLDMIRESIQTHRSITWIFAGRHEIMELTNAAWTSYLVSARTIEVPAFTSTETRLLLTEPLKHSELRPRVSFKRPRFDASLWGKNGIERIHYEAGGWPYLVQFIAETITGLINDEGANVVTAKLMARAIDKSITRGHNVLYELMRRESTLPGEWEYLLAFREAEAQPPPDDENVAASIRRRLLIEEDNGQWRLRVPLMARWLKLKG